MCELHCSVDAWVLLCKCCACYSGQLCRTTVNVTSILCSVINAGGLYYMYLVIKVWSWKYLLNQQGLPNTFTPRIGNKFNRTRESYGNKSPTMWVTIQQMGFLWVFGVDFHSLSPNLLLNWYPASAQECSIITSSDLVLLLDCCYVAVETKSL